MIHHSAPSQPRPAGRGIPRIRRWATGLAVTAIASLAGAPAALPLATCPPAATDPGPVAPPPAPAAAHLPLWAVVTIVAATAVLSVATTLITLSLDTPAPRPPHPGRGRPGRRHATPVSHGGTPGRAGRDSQQPPARGRL